MSKIGQAVHEIHVMDQLAARDQWVNKVHPLVKLVLTISYLVTLVSFSKYDVMGVTGMIVYPMALFLLTELSFSDSLRRLRVVLPLVCLIGLFNPVFDRQILMIGDLPVRAGFLSMFTLIWKGVLSVLASYLLIATTSMEKICYAMRMIRIPRIIVTQIMLMYRYLTVLLEEADRMTQAYQLRAPGQKGIHFRVWGSLVGQLLLKSMDRAGNVYESMLIRGYDGEYGYMGEQIRIAWTDICYFLFWMILFLIFRRWPVMLLAGKAVGGILR